MKQLVLPTGITRSAGHQYHYDGQGPFPGVTAICAMQDAVGGADGLMNWAVGLALDYVGRNQHVLPEEWEHVRQSAFQAKNAARDLGSAVHQAVDQFNRGKDGGVDQMGYETAPYVAQYGAAVYQKGIRILGSEKYVINTTLGFGGTYDSLVEIDGETGPLDVKTGKEKPSQRLQLAGLSMGELHGEEGDEPEAMPPLDGVGFILLLRPDGYVLVRHEIRDEDREHFIRLLETYHRVRAWAEQFAPKLIEENGQ